MPNPIIHTEPRSKRWIWVVYVVLFSASVPWYLPATGQLRLWFGLPYWVVISLAACTTIAIFTAFVITRYWPILAIDDELDGDDAGKPTPVARKPQ